MGWHRGRHPRHASRTCLHCATTPATSCSTTSAGPRADGCWPGWRSAVRSSSAVRTAWKPASAAAAVCWIVGKANQLFETTAPPRIKDLGGVLGVTTPGARARTIMPLAGCDEPGYNRVVVGSPRPARIGAPPAHPRTARPVLGAGVAYKANSMNALYDACMSESGDLRVSSRGQMSLPAEARRRWGFEDGGTVGYLDLGDSILLVPGGVQKLRTRVVLGDHRGRLARRPARFR